MRSELPPRQTENETLPPEIYIPLVDSLFKDGRTLFVGSLCLTASIFVTYWKTGELLLLYCAIAFVVVACARGLVMHRYTRSTVTSAEVARRWERRYVAGAAASVALLGIWCYLTFSRTSDPLAHLISFSMTIAYMVGVFGRNFGNSRFVVVQVLCAWVPMTAALLIYGNWYHWALAVLLIPFFLAIKFIAERLRHTLLDAVIVSRDMSLLATRFDTALNNMPHGLCMFDSNRCVVVANQKLNQQLGLPPDFELKGATVARIGRRCRQRRSIVGTQRSKPDRTPDAWLSGSDDAAFAVDMVNGRTLEFTVQPMENGGMVVLVEDVTERRIAEAKINHLARFDALTGLPNRNVLRDRMEQALAEWRPDNMCAIHFIDLDQFKQVNDTLGHTRGDMLLQAVAHRLRENIGDADVISRFGGDEFVILQAPVKSIEQGEALATRVLNAVAGTYDLDGHKVVVTASIGIALGKNPNRSGPISAQCRHCALSGQVRRSRHLALVRSKNGG